MLQLEDKASKASEEEEEVVEYVVDDEFNLPVSIALLLMVTYMFIGGVLLAHLNSLVKPPRTVL